MLRASKHGYSVMRCFFSIMDIHIVRSNCKTSFQPHTAVVCVCVRGGGGGGCAGGGNFMTGAARHLI